MKFLKLFESKKRFGELTPGVVDDIFMYAHESGSLSIKSPPKYGSVSITNFGGSFYNVFDHTQNIDFSKLKRGWLSMSVEISGGDLTKVDVYNKYQPDIEHCIYHYDRSVLDRIFNRIRNEYDCKIFMRVHNDTSKGWAGWKSRCIIILTDITEKAF